MEKQTLIIAAIGFLIAAALGFLAYSGIGENLVYYFSPTELVAKGEQAVGAQVRLAGLVKDGSIERGAGGTTLAFDLTDGKETVKVHGSAMPPQMFRAGIGVVVEGRVRADGVFESDKLMVKHDNEYQAPEEGKEVDYEKMFDSLQLGDES